MKFFRCSVFAIAALAPIYCLAVPPGGVKVDEVFRRGDSVEHVDGYQAGPESPVYEALQPPESDADKWFVVVLTTPNCSGCKQLIKDWRSDQWLLAIANPDDAKQSWAHFFTYDTSDRSQSFRAKRLNVKTFPTVLVQPPRTGKYGDPSTVVFQRAYQGDPRKLAEGINAAIRLYVEKLNACSGGYQQVPWQPRDDTSDEDESGRKPIFPFFDPEREINIPPVQVEFPSIPWMSIIASLMSGAWPVALVLIAIAGVQIWRWWRKKNGGKLLISDEVFDQIADAVKERIAPKEEPKAATKKTVKRTTRGR